MRVLVLMLVVRAVPQVLKEREFGCGILVSTIAKSTCATYSLRDPAQVVGVPGGGLGEDGQNLLKRKSVRSEM